MKDQMLYDIEKLASVKASRVREIRISVTEEGADVRGWFNSEEYFYFGHFNTLEEARGYVENLHKQIKL